ncbi:MAG TPA: hypothetical protein VMA31_00685 [Bryobacteraceae bacterium]|nr:hypothetical protein [Bryobacteraceae bacterium]
MAALLLSAACMGRPDRETVIAEAYVGPPTLRLRSDIPLQSAVVVTVKHGDRLKVMQRRRRFLRVRTSGGREGWTEESQLLSSTEMADLSELSKRAAALPAQGKGTTYGALNVHTQPQVGAPSFLQIKDGEKFDVLAEVVSPRVPIERAPLIPPPEKKAPAPKKPAKAGKIPPPPLPPPPGLPANWQELSKTNLPADEEGADQPEAKPIPTDHWTLVRTDGGESGWVLTRRVSMAIPDEVAQYAEGRRIVSYFPLGYVQDGDVKKANWLWTTIGDSHQPYDFDSFRVFIWSLRRHRYETAYIERNLQGYAPVLLKDVQVSASARGKTAMQEYPGFSICTEKADGQLHRREFALLGNVVRSAGEEACERQPQVWVTKAAPPAGASPAATSASSSTQHSTGSPVSSGLTARLKQQLQAIRRWWHKAPPTPTQ